MNKLGFAVDRYDMFFFISAIGNEQNELFVSRKVCCAGCIYSAAQFIGVSHLGTMAITTKVRKKYKKIAVKNSGRDKNNVKFMHTETIIHLVQVDLICIDSLCCVERF